MTDVTRLRALQQALSFHDASEPVYVDTALAILDALIDILAPSARSAGAAEREARDPLHVDPPVYCYCGDCRRKRHPTLILGPVAAPAAGSTPTWSDIHLDHALGRYKVNDGRPLDPAIAAAFTDGWNAALTAARNTPEAT
jgi:hypothetical protein